MSERRSIASLLKEAKEEAIQNALRAKQFGDVSGKASWQARRAYLDKVLKQVQTGGLDVG